MCRTPLPERTTLSLTCSPSTMLLRFRMPMCASTPRPCSEREWQGVQSHHKCSGTPGQGVHLRVQAEVGHASEQRVDGKLAFHACERSADAEMNTLPKSQVDPLLTGNIQHVWSGIRLWISIGRGQRDENLIAAPDQLAIQFNILARPALRGGQKRPLIAQQFLNCRFDERGVLPELLQLIGMQQQGQDALADPVGLGLMPGDQKP